MFQLLEKKEDVARAQEQLERTVGKAFKRESVKTIGYPGGLRRGATVRTDGTYWYWSEDHRGAGRKNPRRLNWFGLFLEKGMVQISVEINVPYQGLNRNVAGFFARHTDTGSIYLFHSGRVGGGTKGVKRSAFLAHSNEKLVDVFDSDGGVRQAVLVMPVQGRSAVHPAIRYVDAVAAFKKAVRDGVTQTQEFIQKQRKLEDFYAEPSGRRKGSRSSEIDYVSRHGDVVNELGDWLRRRGLPGGGRLVKDVRIDAGVEVRKKLVEVYEVKTSTSRQDAYTAIGQLMVHGTSSRCRRVVALPDDEPILKDLRDAFGRLGIGILKFKLDEKTVKIIPK